PGVPPAAAAPAGGEAARLDVAGHFDDPKGFLLAVMNDPSAGAGLRIEAAKALLPYFHRPL
ncbi:MAG: terminase small subunit, partial [Zoogloea sp.]|nr:terminase small subunit [Zoogloea sp.]